MKTKLDYLRYEGSPQNLNVCLSSLVLSRQVTVVSCTIVVMCFKQYAAQ